MIQVLKKSSCLLVELSNRHYATLAELSEATGFNNSTVCNILKTLASINYVEKTGPNKYSLGSGLAKLAFSLSRKYLMSSLAEEYTKELAERTKESGIFSVLFKGEITILAKTVYNRSIIINASVNENFLPLSTASGRVILSFLPQVELDSLVKTFNISTRAVYDLSSYDELYRKLKLIKQKNMVVMKNLDDSDIYALAAPVFDKDNRIFGALALNVPAIRFQGENREKIISTLKHMSEKLTYAVSLR